MTTWANIRHETFQFFVWKAEKAMTVDAFRHNRKKIRRMQQNGLGGDELDDRVAMGEILRYQKDAAREDYVTARPAFINTLRQFNYHNEIALVDPVDVWALDFARKYGVAPAAPGALAPALTMRYRLGTSCGVYNRDEMVFVSSLLEWPIDIPEVGQHLVLAFDMP